MPFISLLILPLKLFLGFKLYFQYSAPLGDMSIGYSKINKSYKKWWYALVGHSFNFLIKKAIKISDIVFSISEYHKNELIFLTTENKIVPITMGVDETWVKKKRNQLPYFKDLKKKNFVITYFGSLGFTRNHEFILQTFAEILDKCQNCKLILIGQTSESWEKKELDLICLNLGINRHVIFTGYLNRNKLHDILFYCDLSLSLIPPKSYYKVSSPTKLYESLGCGVPVVGNKEIYEQEKVILESGGGIVVDYNKTASSNAILELLRDRKLRKKMATRGRKYVLDNYSYQYIAKKISPYFI
jgi:glycosyltransferase involved in cell wall biosynthesis